MVAYVRVSALMGRGGETFHSPELQITAIEQLAARTGATVVEVVQDIDVSGRGFARVGLDRVLQLAQAREVDCVGLYDLSRLGRNTGESLRCVATLRDLGVSIASTVEQIDDSPEGQFMLGQFLGMAQLYSDQIGRKWRQVIDRRARQGLWHGSNPPLGYRLADGLQPDPLLGPAMREAFERYARGELVSHIARDLGRLRGKALPISMLKRALGNPVYAGQVRAGGDVHPGRHEALVDDVTWQRVQRRLAQDSRTPSRRLAVSHSLVGLIVCDHCGRHLQLHTQPQVGERHRTGRVQCRLRLEGGPQACPGPGAPKVTEIEAAVLDGLLPLLERLAVDPARGARKAAASSDLNRLRRELAKTEAAIGRLATDLARRDISVTAYRVASEQLEAEAEALRARLEDLEPVAVAPSARAQVRQARALVLAWEAMTVAEQNRGLRLLLREVRVRRAVTYREPVAQRVELVPIS